MLQQYVLSWSNTQVSESAQSRPPTKQSALNGAFISWAAVQAAVLCWAARREMLDDALIHLRYASVLHQRHILSYDGLHANYGASSILYVALLALLQSLTHSPLLPKVVSLAAYAGMLVFAVQLTRIKPAAVVLMLLLAGPFAVRWLTDGMETSLACLMAMAFAFLLERKAAPLILAAAASILPLLRVDLTVLIGVAVILLVYRRERTRAAAVCTGSLLSLAFIRIATGHLLPDTAIAKQGLPAAIVSYDILHAFIASGSFGIGVLLFWIASFISAVKAHRATAVICNLAFPAVVAAIILRGHQIHGVRYMIWALLFSISWNLLSSAANTPQIRPRIMIGLASALVLVWSMELGIVLHIDRGRTETLRTMEQAHLDQLSGPGVAADVGFIGYFSKAPICDLNGLVNGRAAARMTRAQRAQACMSGNPSFLFLTSDQIDVLNAETGFNPTPDWDQCGTVDFTNAGEPDRHVLLVRRSKYRNGCPVHLESLQDKETHRLSTSSAPL